MTVSRFSIKNKTKYILQIFTLFKQSLPIPSPSYDPSTSYYPSYFWPSPIVDNRTMGSYSTNPHTPTFYE
jgi:hypothetical protein